MNKIAILIIGAEAPKTLRRTLETFDDPRFRFFLHVDAGADLDLYMGELGPSKTITLIEPRIPVFRGGFSTIEAECALVRAALADETVGSVVLWSDDTMPLHQADIIYRSLIEKPDRIASQMLPQPQDWYKQFFFLDSRFTGPQHSDVQSRHFEPADWQNMQRLQRLVERGKKRLQEVYFSGKWWALSRDSSEAILRYMEQDEHLVESFRFSLFPDRTLFATVFRLCFPNIDVPQAPTFEEREDQPAAAVSTQLPDQGSAEQLPEHYLFVRQLGVSGTALTGVAASNEMLQNVAKVAGSEPASSSTPAVPENDEEFNRSLATAIDAREDGDVEESVALFQSALDLRPGHPQGSLEYVHTLKKLRRLEEADKILDIAIALHPDDGKLLHVWADLPGQIFDHDEIIRRAEIYRAAFPPTEHPGAWHSLAVQFGSFTESLRWNDLSDSIQAQKQNAVRFPNALRVCLWQATELCLTEVQTALVEAAQPEAWAQLPPEAKHNIRLRIALTELNRKLLTAAQTSVFSIGQNCLPYLLGGRWGLIAQRERPEAMTPFDRGAFRKDAAGTVIGNDFATFSDRAAFSETVAWDGARIYRHDATDVHFYHERGATWFKNNSEKFFPHVNRMVDNWRNDLMRQRRLFVFCLCGEGDLHKLVEIMDRHLLGPDSHLLVIDVLQQIHACPVHQHVTYVHIPYPSHYAWDNFTHQSSARGVGFELSVMIEVTTLVSSFLSQEEANLFKTEQSRLLEQYAAGAWPYGHDNSIAIYSALHRVEPAHKDHAVAYARVLRDGGKSDEAQKVLEQARRHEPENYDLHVAWADLGTAPFDVRTRLTRLQSLREIYPPEVEPRSWGRLAEELKTLAGHGFWNEARTLIGQRRQDFLTRPELFREALETMINLGNLAEARQLVKNVDAAVREMQPPNMLSCVQERLDKADANRAVVQRAGVQVLPLGQNSMLATFAVRWGLQAAARAFDECTPFELGDFYQDSAAQAISDNFEALSNHEQYVEKPAWGGGNVLRHSENGVAFMVHRAAQMGPSESKRFFAHLDSMIAHWRRVSQTGPRIFWFAHGNSGNLEQLVSVIKEKLLDARARLVILDLNETPAGLPPDPQISLLHAPLPGHYPWFSPLASATAEGLAYEQMVLAPVMHRIEELEASLRPKLEPASNRLPNRLLRFGKRRSTAG